MPRPQPAWRCMQQRPPGPWTTLRPSILNQKPLCCRISHYRLVDSPDIAPICFYRAATICRISPTPLTDRTQSIHHGDGYRPFCHSGRPRRADGVRPAAGRRPDAPGSHPGRGRRTLRRLHPDHRRCHRRRARPHRDQRGLAPRPAGMGPRPTRPQRPARAHGRHRLRAPPAAAGHGRARRSAAAPPGALAHAGGHLLHDAGHDVRRAPLHGRRRHPARPAEADDLGRGHAHHPGAALCGRPLLHGCLARYPAGPHRHGHPGGTGHRHHRHHQRGGLLSGARGLFRFGDDDHRPAARGPLAGVPRPRTRRGRPGQQPGATPRSRRPPARRRQHRARLASPPAARRPHLGPRRHHLRRRRPHPGRPQRRGRITAHRRIRASAARPRHACRLGQPQPAQPADRRSHPPCRRFPAGRAEPPDRARRHQPPHRAAHRRPLCGPLPRLRAAGGPDCRHCLVVHRPGTRPLDRRGHPHRHLPVRAGAGGPLGPAGHAGRPGAPRHHHRPQRHAGSPGPQRRGAVRQDRHPHHQHPGHRAGRHQPRPFRG